jgi:predicted nucleic acid-binding protein
VSEFVDKSVVLPRCRVNCSLIVAARCIARAYTGLYGARVLDRLFETLTAYRATGRQVHDANIVATMLDCGVRRLLTFNLTDFRRFAPLIEMARLP